MSDARGGDPMDGARPLDANESLIAKWGKSGPIGC